MKCEQIQELILTDYIDGQLKGQPLAEFEEHMMSCAACREFLSVAKKSAVTPFTSATRVELAKDKIWQKIKDEIHPEVVERENPVSNFINNLKRAFSTPQTIGVFAAIVAVLFVTSVLIKTDNVQISQSSLEAESEEITYIAYVANEFSSEHLDEDEYGTLIEEYFL